MHQTRPSGHGGEVPFVTVAAQQARRRAGISLPAGTVQKLEAAAKRFGVPLPDFMQ